LKLPPVPAIPVLTQTPTEASAAKPKAPAQPPSAPTFSLAEALGGARTPDPRTPILLMSSLTPGGASEAQPREFIFTMRKADGADLGLNVTHGGGAGQGLKVEGVRAVGAIEAWNRLATDPEKVVRAGDMIVEVNGIRNDPVKMLQECKDKLCIKFKVMRLHASSPAPARLPASASPPASIATAATPLRAGSPAPVPTKCASEASAANRVAWPEAGSGTDAYASGGTGTTP
jgi:hypothetical protein